MNRIEIKDGPLSAYVYPDYGGMAGRLMLEGTEILKLDESRLPEGAVLAGGNPVLFPFPGKTADDRYELYGKHYRMPFHGLVRDSAFGVECAEPSAVTLVRTGGPEWMRDLYPFDFTLKLVYAIKDQGLRLTAIVENHSDRPMPHAFGWHPYFTVSDKTCASVSVNMSHAERWDETGKREIEIASASYAERADFVFSGRNGNLACLESPADGYGVHIWTDEAFRALVVCTKFAGTICVEPWMGLPGAINTRENLSWVPAKSEARYDTLIEPYFL